MDEFALLLSALLRSVGWGWGVISHHELGHVIEGLEVKGQQPIFQLLNRKCFPLQ